MENNSGYKLRAAFAAGQKSQKAESLMVSVNDVIETASDYLAVTNLDAAADCYDAAASECDRAEWPERADDMRMEAAKCRKLLAEIEAKHARPDATLALFGGR